MDMNDPFKKTFGCKCSARPVCVTVSDPHSVASKRKGQLAPMENKPKQEDILNAILQPREWVENGKHYI